MKVTKNLGLNRYEWAALKINQILNEEKLVRPDLFDIGSRDNVLKKQLNETSLVYKGYDLEPLTDARKWDIEQPFPYSDNPADIVTLLEVVEHLVNPGICLRNVAQIIKNGGFLILTTPNPKWSASRLHLLTNGQLSCFTQSDLDLNHHVFTPWDHIIEKMLKDSGFSIVEYVTLDGQTVIFDKTLGKSNIVKSLIARTMKKYIELKDPSSCGMSYGVVAKKVA